MAVTVTRASGEFAKFRSGSGTKRIGDSGEPLEGNLNCNWEAAL